MASGEEPRLNQWRSFVEEWLPTLGLQGWAIEVRDDCPIPDTDWANVRVWVGQQRAQIRLAPDFKTQAPSEQRRLLLHELMHVVLQDYQLGVAESQWQAWEWLVIDKVASILSRIEEASA
ncbi:MAG: hypothetical protein AAF851_05740 [Myxococcota bacterium]